MASDNETSCASDPNFAVICSFLEKFARSCGITHPNMLELQEMLENTLEVPQPLVDLHVKLLRKARKSVSGERWEKAIIKFCHSYSNQDGWEIERFGYKKARISVKLRILKMLLELQFDMNTKFKTEVNRLSADELRCQPLGRDKMGQTYWCQLDEDCNLRVYREDLDDETWEVVARDREGLVQLISQLSSNDPFRKDTEAILNEDSNSLEIEKPITDTGQPADLQEETTAAESPDEDEEEDDDDEEFEEIDDEDSEDKEDDNIPDAAESTVGRRDGIATLKLEAGSKEECISKSTDSKEGSDLKIIESKEESALKPIEPKEESALKPKEPKEEVSLKPTEPNKEISQKSTEPKEEISLKPTGPKEEKASKPTEPKEESVLKPPELKEESALKLTELKEESTLKPTESKEEGALKPTKPKEESASKSSECKVQNILKPVESEESPLKLSESKGQLASECTEPEEERDMMKPIKLNEESALKLIEPKEKSDLKPVDVKELILMSAETYKENPLKSCASKEECILKQTEPEEKCTTKAEELKDHLLKHASLKESALVSVDLKEKLVLNPAQCSEDLVLKPTDAKDKHVEHTDVLKSVESKTECLVNLAGSKEVFASKSTEPKEHCMLKQAEIKNLQPLASVEPKREYVLKPEGRKQEQALKSQKDILVVKPTESKKEHLKVADFAGREYTSDKVTEVEGRKDSFSSKVKTPVKERQILVPSKSELMLENIPHREYFGMDLSKSARPRDLQLHSSNIGIDLTSKANIGERNLQSLDKIEVMNESSTSSSSLVAEDLSDSSKRLQSTTEIYEPNRFGALSLTATDLSTKRSVDLLQTPKVPIMSAMPEFGSLTVNRLNLSGKRLHETELMTNEAKKLRLEQTVAANCHKLMPSAIGPPLPHYGDDSFDSEDSTEVGEAIEEPLMLVRGEGSGADCNTGNPGKDGNNGNSNCDTSKNNQVSADTAESGSTVSEEQGNVSTNKEEIPEKSSENSKLIAKNISNVSAMQSEDISDSTTKNKSSNEPKLEKLIEKTTIESIDQQLSSKCLKANDESNFDSNIKQIGESSKKIGKESSLSNFQTLSESKETSKFEEDTISPFGRCEVSPLNKNLSREGEPMSQFPPKNPPKLWSIETICAPDGKSKETPKIGLSTSKASGSSVLGVVSDSLYGDKYSSKFQDTEASGRLNLGTSSPTKRPSRWDVGGGKTQKRDEAESDGKDNILQSESSHAADTSGQKSDKLDKGSKDPMVEEQKVTGDVPAVDAANGSRPSKTNSVVESRVQVCQKQKFKFDIENIITIVEDKDKTKPSLKCHTDVKTNLYIDKLQIAGAEIQTGRVGAIPVKQEETHECKSQECHSTGKTAEKDGSGDMKTNAEKFHPQGFFFGPGCLLKSPIKKTESSTSSSNIDSVKADLMKTEALGEEEEEESSSTSSPASLFTSEKTSASDRLLPSGGIQEKNQVSLEESCPDVSSVSSKILTTHTASAFPIKKESPSKGNMLHSIDTIMMSPHKSRDLDNFPLQTASSVPFMSAAASVEMKQKSPDKLSDHTNRPLAKPVAIQVSQIKEKEHISLDISNLTFLRTNVSKVLQEEKETTSSQSLPEKKVSKTDSKGVISKESSGDGLREKDLHSLSAKEYTNIPLSKKEVKIHDISEKTESLKVADLGEVHSSSASKISRPIPIKNIKGSTVESLPERTKNFDSTSENVGHENVPPTKKGVTSPSSETSIKQSIEVGFSVAKPQGTKLSNLEKPSKNTGHEKKQDTHSHTVSICKPSDNEAAAEKQDQSITAVSKENSTINASKQEIKTPVEKDAKTKTTFLEKSALDTANVCSTKENIVTPSKTYASRITDGNVEVSRTDSSNVKIQPSASISKMEGIPVASKLHDERKLQELAVNSSTVSSKEKMGTELLKEIPKNQKQNPSVIDTKQQGSHTIEISLENKCVNPTKKTVDTNSSSNDSNHKKSTSFLKIDSRQDDKAAMSSLSSVSSMTQQAIPKNDLVNVALVTTKSKPLSSEMGLDNITKDDVGKNSATSLKKVKTDNSSLLDAQQTKEAVLKNKDINKSEENLDSENKVPKSDDVKLPVSCNVTPDSQIKQPEKSETKSDPVSAIKEEKREQIVPIKSEFDAKKEGSLKPSFAFEKISEHESGKEKSLSTGKSALNSESRNEKSFLKTKTKQSGDSTNEGAACDFVSKGETKTISTLDDSSFSSSSSSKSISKFAVKAGADVSSGADTKTRSDCCVVPKEKSDMKPLIASSGSTASKYVTATKKEADCKSSETSKLQSGIITSDKPQSQPSTIPPVKTEATVSHSSADKAGSKKVSVIDSQTVKSDIAQNKSASENLGVKLDSGSLSKPDLKSSNSSTETYKVSSADSTKLYPVRPPTGQEKPTFSEDTVNTNNKTRDKVPSSISTTTIISSVTSATTTQASDTKLTSVSSPEVDTKISENKEKSKGININADRIPVTSMSDKLTKSMKVSDVEVKTKTDLSAIVENKSKDALVKTEILARVVKDDSIRSIEAEKISALISSDKSGMVSGNASYDQVTDKSNSGSGHNFKSKPPSLSKFQQESKLENITAPKTDVSSASTSANNVTSPSRPLTHSVGAPCDPVLVKGNKEQHDNIAATLTLVDVAQTSAHNKNLPVSVIKSDTNKGKEIKPGKLEVQSANVLGDRQSEKPSKHEDKPIVKDIKQGMKEHELEVHKDKSKTKRDAALVKVTSTITKSNLCESEKEVLPKSAISKKMDEVNITKDSNLRKELSDIKKSEESPVSDHDVFKSTVVTDSKGNLTERELKKQENQSEKSEKTSKTSKVEQILENLSSKKTTSGLDKKQVEIPEQKEGKFLKASSQESVPKKVSIEHSKILAGNISPMDPTCNIEVKRNKDTTSETINFEKSTEEHRSKDQDVGKERSGNMREKAAEPTSSSSSEEDSLKLKLSSKSEKDRSSIVSETNKKLHDVNIKELVSESESAASEMKPHLGDLSTESKEMSYLRDKYSPKSTSEPKVMLSGPLTKSHEAKVATKFISLENVGAAMFSPSATQEDIVTIDKPHEFHSLSKETMKSVPSPKSPAIKTPVASTSKLKNDSQNKGRRKSLESISMGIMMGKVAAKSSLQEPAIAGAGGTSEEVPEQPEESEVSSSTCTPQENKKDCVKSNKSGLETNLSELQEQKVTSDNAEAASKQNLKMPQSIEKSLKTDSEESSQLPCTKESNLVHVTLENKDTVIDKNSLSATSYKVNVPAKTTKQVSPVLKKSGEREERQDAQSPLTNQKGKIDLLERHDVPAVTDDSIRQTSGNRAPEDDKSNISSRREKKFTLSKALEIKNDENKIITQKKTNLPPSGQGKHESLNIRVSTSTSSKEAKSTSEAAVVESSKTILTDKKDNKEQAGKEGELSPEKKTDKKLVPDTSLQKDIKLIPTDNKDGKEIADKKEIFFSEKKTDKKVVSDISLQKDTKLIPTDKKDGKELADKKEEFSSEEKTEKIISETSLKKDTKLNPANNKDDKELADKKEELSSDEKTEKEIVSETSLKKDIKLTPADNKDDKELADKKEELSSEEKTEKEIVSLTSLKKDIKLTPADNKDDKELADKKGELSSEKKIEKEIVSETSLKKDTKLITTVNKDGKEVSDKNKELSSEKKTDKLVLDTSLQKDTKLILIDNKDNKGLADRKEELSSEKKTDKKVVSDTSFKKDIKLIPTDNKDGKELADKEEELFSEKVTDKEAVSEPSLKKDTKLITTDNKDGKELVDKNKEFSSENKTDKKLVSETYLQKDTKLTPADNKDGKKLADKKEELPSEKKTDDKLVSGMSLKKDTKLIPTDNKDGKELADKKEELSAEKKTDKKVVSDTSLKEDTNKKDVKKDDSSNVEKYLDAKAAVSMTITTNLEKTTPDKDDIKDTSKTELEDSQTAEDQSSGDDADREDVHYTPGDDSLTEQVSDETKVRSPSGQKRGQTTDDEDDDEVATSKRSRVSKLVQLEGAGGASSSEGEERGGDPEGSSDEGDSEVGIVGKRGSSITLARPKGGRGRRGRGRGSRGRSRTHRAATEKSASPTPTRVSEGPKKEEDSSAPVTPTKPKLGRGKRAPKLLGLDLGVDIVLEESRGEEEGRPGAPPVRQSRRIAQMKIREEAERRKLEEMTLQQLKEEQSRRRAEKKESKEGKKRKKIVESDEDFTAEDVDDEVFSKKKLKKKKIGRKKIPALNFNENNPWQSSSGSSTSQEEEEEAEQTEEEDDDELIFKSDHEFSPESDLENDADDITPRRRARTAQKGVPCEDEEQPADEHACQKCGKSDHPEWILLCDKCDSGWHGSCLRPALMVIPEGDWFCPPCEHTFLLENLHNNLREFDRNWKRRENEQLRRKRLAYVGISLNNVLPNKEGSGGESGTETKKEPAAATPSGSEGSGSESGSTSDEDSEPVYQLRQRRQTLFSYRFSEYDDLINSAIQDEMEAVKGAGNQGRGKDIATIVKAEAEAEAEAQAEAQARAEELQNSQQQSVENQEKTVENVEEKKVEEEEPVREEIEKEELPPVVPKHDIKDEDEEEDEFCPFKKFQIRKKHRRLNSLDISSEDDAESDEDFKGTSSEDDEDEYEEASGLSEDSEFAGRRGKGSRRKASGPVRRSSRARITRFDKEFINDDSEDSEPPKKKSRRLWQDSDSEESDASWRRSKKSKKQVTTFKPNKSKSKKKKKKRSKRDGDSDLEVYKVKKPKIKFGGLDEEDVSLTRRTRGRKINYQELGASDSEEETWGRARKLESEDEYVANEDDDEEEEEEVVPEVEKDSENESGEPLGTKKVIKIKTEKKAKPRKIVKNSPDKTPRRGRKSVKANKKTFIDSEEDIPPCPGVQVPGDEDPANGFVSQQSVNTQTSETEMTAAEAAILPLGNFPKERTRGRTRGQGRKQEEQKKKGKRKKKNDPLYEEGFTPGMGKGDANVLGQQLADVQMLPAHSRMGAEMSIKGGETMVQRLTTSGRGMSISLKANPELGPEGGDRALLLQNAKGVDTDPLRSLLAAPPVIPPDSELKVNEDVPPPAGKRKGRGRGKAGAKATDVGHYPLQGFSQSGSGIGNANSGSVITRMLQSQPVSGAPQSFTAAAAAMGHKYFGSSSGEPSMMPIQNAGRGTSSVPPFSGPPKGLSSPYRQPPPADSSNSGIGPGMSHYGSSPPTRGTGIRGPHGFQGGRLRNPPPSGQSHMFHSSHHPMDPSPSGGGPIIISSAAGAPPAPAGSPHSTKPGTPSTSQSTSTPPPPPYSRPGSQLPLAPPTSTTMASMMQFPPQPGDSSQPPVRHPPPPFPPSTSASHLQTSQGTQQSSPPTHQGRSPVPGNFSPYHPPPPANYHYGGYPPPPPMSAADDALPPSAFQGSPYTDHYTSSEMTANLQASDGSNSKSYDEEGGGEFGGLVSYFSSQREDDLDT